MHFFLHISIWLNSSITNTPRVKEENQTLRVDIIHFYNLP